MSDDAIVKRPQVATSPRRAPVAVVGTALATLGLGVFLWLSDARAAQQDEDALPSLTSPASVPTAEALNLGGATAPSPAATGGFMIPTNAPAAIADPRLSGQTAFQPAMQSFDDPMRDRLRAPALIVDMAQNALQQKPGIVLARSESGDDRLVASTTIPVAPAAGTDRNLSDTERFAARIGDEEVEVAVARRMSGLDLLVPQGAIVGAVMETALNSDLPGFARAVVQRDVRSFDGSTVLIPTGSRVIGQYKSGVAQGASRVFVLWTRLIRPDGVTIELASPAVDDLGRGGIGGKVNRHFLQRFSGAILTSVLSAGLNAAAASASGGSTIIVGSGGQASSLASQASQNTDIPPTITTRQGTPVRIFVARDLDFSRVGPMP